MTSCHRLPGLRVGWAEDSTDNLAPILTQNLGIWTRLDAMVQLQSRPAQHLPSLVNHWTNSPCLGLETTRLLTQIWAWKVQGGPCRPLARGVAFSLPSPSTAVAGPYRLLTPGAVFSDPFLRSSAPGHAPRLWSQTPHGPGDLPTTRTFPDRGSSPRGICPQLLGQLLA